MLFLIGMGTSIMFHIIRRIYSKGSELTTKHKIIPSQDITNKNLLIVGDVHGCYDEFKILYTKAQNRSQKRIFIIMVGDMINKGPKNLEMLDFLIENKDVHCIRGNHEEFVLKCLKDPKNKNNPDWIRNIKDVHKNYLINLPYSISITSLNILIVHAGLVPGTQLKQQNNNDLLNMRSLKWIQDDFHGFKLIGSSHWDGIPWAKCWKGPPHVYFGHDAVSKLQLHKDCTGIDTGCVYGGKLTGILLHLPDCEINDINHNNIKREFISVTPKVVYKPP